MPYDDAGYATPAAMVIGLTLALVATAVVARSLAEMKLADQEFAKARTELELAAAHNAAAMAVATASKPPPYRWVVPILGEAIDVVAEPEIGKLAMSQASSQLDETAVAAFQVSDGPALRGRLSNRTGQLSWIADDDEAPMWRNCAAAYISPYGLAGVFSAPDYKDPDAGKSPTFWRAGEVWRIVATQRDGWREERLVRFTGDGNDPVAIINRRVQKGKGGLPQCETLFG